MSNLKIHIEGVHEGEKPYKCSICDHSFAIKGKLKIHIDSVHDGKKPNKCLICDRSFARMDQLKRHVNSVNEEKKAINVQFVTKLCTIGPIENIF